jgi:hypothetical protein
MPNIFQIFCHENCRCTLKVEDQDNVHEFESVAEAIRAVLQLAGPDKSRLRVYSTLGAKVFEAFLQ